MMGADAVWEWTGANSPGYGDPLARDPGLVETDVATGALRAEAAERVYGVVPGDSETQQTARTERLASRLADAVPPAGPLPRSRPACRCGFGRRTGLGGT